MTQIDYEAWISRERKIRISICKDSLRRSKNPVIRTCLDCGEICLCHEPKCPNCNSSRIMTQKIENLDAEFLRGRIRCQYRYTHLGEA